VIDNDNLDSLSGTINVVGETPAATDDQAKKAADEKTQKSGESAKGETYWRQKFADANKKLTDDQHELDIMQREYNLKQQQYYADPMATLKQEYTRQDLNDSKTKIDDKTAVVAQDKADISDLEDQLRQAGGDPGWAAPPAQPAPESAPKP
jgi:chromosome segregation ATPase